MDEEMPLEPDEGYEESDFAKMLLRLGDNTTSPKEEYSNSVVFGIFDIMNTIFDDLGGKYSTHRVLPFALTCIDAYNAYYNYVNAGRSFLRCVMCANQPGKQWPVPFKVGLPFVKSMGTRVNVLAYPSACYGVEGRPEKALIINEELVEETVLMCHDCCATAAPDNYHAGGESGDPSESRREVSYGLLLGLYKKRPHLLHSLVSMYAMRSAPELCKSLERENGAVLNPLALLCDRTGLTARRDELSGKETLYDQTMYSYAFNPYCIQDVPITRCIMGVLSNMRGDDWEGRAEENTPDPDEVKRGETEFQQFRKCRDADADLEHCLRTRIMGHAMGSFDYDTFEKNIVQNFQQEACREIGSYCGNDERIASPDWAVYEYERSWNPNPDFRVVCMPSDTALPSWSGYDFEDDFHVVDGKQFFAFLGLNVCLSFPDCKICDFCTSNHLSPDLGGEYVISANDMFPGMARADRLDYEFYDYKNALDNKLDMSPRSLFWGYESRRFVNRDFSLVDSFFRNLRFVDETYRCFVLDAFFSKYTAGSFHTRSVQECAYTYNPLSVNEHVALAPKLVWWSSYYRPFLCKSMKSKFRKRLYHYDVNKGENKWRSTALLAATCMNPGYRPSTLWRRTRRDNGVVMELENPIISKNDFSDIIEVSRQFWESDKTGKYVADKCAKAFSLAYVKHMERDTSHRNHLHLMYDNESFERLLTIAASVEYKEWVLDCKFFDLRNNGFRRFLESNEDFLKSLVLSYLASPNRLWSTLCDDRNLSMQQDEGYALNLFGPYYEKVTSRAQNVVMNHSFREQVAQVWDFVELFVKLEGYYPTDFDHNGSAIRHTKHEKKTAYDTGCTGLLHTAFYPHLAAADFSFQRKSKRREVCVVCQRKLSDMELNVLSEEWEIIYTACVKLGLWRTRRTFVKPLMKMMRCYAKTMWTCRTVSNTCMGFLKDQEFSKVPLLRCSKEHFVSQLIYPVRYISDALYAHLKNWRSFCTDAIDSDAVYDPKTDSYWDEYSYIGGDLQDNSINSQLLRGIDRVSQSTGHCNFGTPSSRQFANLRHYKMILAPKNEFNFPVEHLLRVGTAFNKLVLDIRKRLSSSHQVMIPRSFPSPATFLARVLNLDVSSYKLSTVHRNTVMEKPKFAHVFDSSKLATLAQGELFIDRTYCNDGNLSELCTFDPVYGGNSVLFPVDLWDKSRSGSCTLNAHGVNPCYSCGHANLGLRIKDPPNLCIGSCEFLLAMDKAAHDPKLNLINGAHDGGIFCLAERCNSYLCWGCVNREMGDNGGAVYRDRSPCSIFSLAMMGFLYCPLHQYVLNSWRTGHL